MTKQLDLFHARERIGTLRENKGDREADIYANRHGGSHGGSRGGVAPDFKKSRFNGAAYSPNHDDQRLRGQIKRVYDCMSDGAWLTLDEIAAVTGDPAASVSAQLRHLRKERFGGYTVNKRARGDRKHGLFEYQIKVG